MASFTKQMAIACDGSRVPAVLERMPCGGVPLFDHDSGCAYRCDTCYAVIGSIGQPQHCIDINEDEANRKIEWDMLAGKS